MTSSVQPNSNTNQTNQTSQTNQVPLEQNNQSSGISGTPSNLSSAQNNPTQEQSMSLKDYVLYIPRAVGKFLLGVWNFIVNTLSYLNPFSSSKQTEDKGTPAQKTEGPEVKDPKQPKVEETENK